MTIQNNYEEKNWRTFFIIFISYFAVFSVIIIAGVNDVISSDICARGIFVLTSLMLILFAFVIKKHNRVYWISGISYDDACKMSESERKTTAENLYTTFTHAFVILLIYLIAGFICTTPLILDSSVFTITVVFSSLKVMKHNYD